MQLQTIRKFPSVIVTFEPNVIQKYWHTHVPEITFLDEINGSWLVRIFATRDHFHSLTFIAHLFNGHNPISFELYHTFNNQLCHRAALQNSTYRFRSLS